MALLSDQWKHQHGALFTNIAIATSLLAFTFSLALTQFHQQQEIAERKNTAQVKLTSSNLQVSLLLGDARRQTEEITQISELGGLLQAYLSRDGVFRLIPERLRRLFSGSSGCVALISSSRNGVESVAERDIGPADHLFAPDECWALTEDGVGSCAVPRGTSASRCSHLMGNGAAVCLPLNSNGEAIGSLAIQNNEEIISAAGEPDANSDVYSPRRCQLAAAVAEHLALSISNLLCGKHYACKRFVMRSPVCITGVICRNFSIANSTPRAENIGQFP